MHRVADGVLPSISSSNKIAPVEVDPPPTETALLAERAGGGPMKGQDQLAPVDDVLGKICSLEEIEAAGSLASENVGVGDGEAGSDDVVSQGVRTEDVAPPGLQGRSVGINGESDIDKGDFHLRGQEHGNGPLRSACSISSSSSASSASGYQEYGGHELKVAVTPDGKIITGRCLTYEDGRGRPLANNFFIDELHYSLANPSYHKRNKGGWKRCGNAGCTVT